VVKNNFNDIMGKGKRKKEKGKRKKESAFPSYLFPFP